MKIVDNRMLNMNFMYHMYHMYQMYQMLHSNSFQYKLTPNKDIRIFPSHAFRGNVISEH